MSQSSVGSGGLLRPRCERTRRRRTSNQRDELATPHSITSSARASNVGGISRPSAFAVLRSMIGSTFVICWIGKPRCRNATLHGWPKLRHPAQLTSVCLPRAQPAVERSPASPGDNYLSFSLFALGVSDCAAVCPRQLAVQSAWAARQSFECTAYGMSLTWLSGGPWLMLHAINI
jgi:hypothetical protein